MTTFVKQLFDELPQKIKNKDFSQRAKYLTKSHPSLAPEIRAYQLQIETELDELRVLFGLK